MAAPEHILIIDPVHEILMQSLSDAGYAYTYSPDVKRSTLLVEAPYCTGLVVRTKTIIDREFMDAFPTLRFIARVGAGMDNVDEIAAKEKGITCFNAPEGNRDAVAEHALGMMLALNNRFRKAHQEIGSGIWDREGNRGLELGAQTIGIIGYGNAGRALAKKLSGFGSKVLAYDKYHQESDDYAKWVDLEQLRAKADVISLHVPLTEDTRYAYNHTFFSACNKPLLLINTSRGEVLPLADLIRLLEDGKVWAAGLDVLPNEKPNTWSAEEQQQMTFLQEHPQVLLSPHVAGWTVESYRKLSEVIAEKICNFLQKHK